MISQHLVASFWHLVTIKDFSSRILLFEYCELIKALMCQLMLISCFCNLSTDKHSVEYGGVVLKFLSLSHRLSWKLHKRSCMQCRVAFKVNTSEG